MYFNRYLITKESYDECQKLGTFIYAKKCTVTSIS